MKNISELVFERQILLFGHVASLSSNDHAHKILSSGNPLGKKRGRGRLPKLFGLKFSFNKKSFCLT